MPDIKVMALTYTLEERTNGLDNIRTEPLRVSTYIPVYHHH